MPKRESGGGGYGRQLRRMGVPHEAGLDQSLTDLRQEYLRLSMQEREVLKKWVAALARPDDPIISTYVRARVEFGFLFSA